MSNFVWILPTDKLSSLGKKGVSPSYIVPKQQMNFLEKDLASGTLWMVLREGEDRCIGALAVKKVEKFSEGYHSNDFLLTCDLTSSARFSTDYEHAARYTVVGMQAFPSGIHKISDEEIAKVRDAVSNSIQVKLTPPIDGMFSNVKFDATAKRGAGVLRAALSQIVQDFPLNQLWASGMGSRLSPFAYFAQKLLNLHGYDESAQNDAFLKSADPLSGILGQGGEIAANREKALRQRGTVDLDFTEIDPSTVYAREFVSSSSEIDLEAALSKTEAAEKLHQTMLRDISSYLKEKSITPYESESVDLMVCNEGMTSIFEIKSSTDVNIIAQAAKGAFQIACYVNAMKTDYEPLRAALILHKIRDEYLEEFVQRALNHLGITYLIYDPEKEWPYRVGNLLVSKTS